MPARPRKLVLTGTSFHSAVLGRRIDYLALAPHGQAIRPAGHPVITLLHGSGGDDREFIDHLGLEDAIEAVLDDETLPLPIIIMPDAGPSWYVDDVEHALSHELPDHVSQRFPVSGHGRSEAIGGLSMGGYGALRFALLAPERFKAALLLAPAIMTEPKPHSAARRPGVFGTPFDDARWAARHPAAMMDAFFGSGASLPLFIGAADHDVFELDEEAARLHAVWRRRGLPSALRIVGGGHDCPSIAPLLPEGLRFLLSHLRE